MRRFGQRLLFLLASAGMAVICPESLMADEPGNEEEIGRIAGETYFDFAFRDTKDLLQRGTVGGERGEMFAQDDASSDESASDDDMAEDSGNGLSAPEQPVLRSNVVGMKQQVRIADLILNCPELKQCSSKGNIEAFLRVTGLELGHLTTGSDLALAIERLRKTGYFSRIQQTLSVSGDRVYVTFDAEPHTVINRVIIDERGSMREAEIRRRMILRPGGNLYPRTALLRGMDVDAISREELIRMAIDDQEKSLERVYVKEGYFDTDVHIDIEEVEKDRVNLHVRAENSYDYAIGKVYVRGHHAKNYAEIEDIFRSEFKFFGVVTKADIEDAVEAVVNAYHQEGYYQVKIDFVSRFMRENRTIDVFLDITEGMRWEIRFDGNDSLSDAELMEALTFADSGFVDNAEVTASEEALTQAYVSAGYYRAEVTGEMPRASVLKKRRKKLESDEQGNVVAMDTAPVISFHIKEGKRYEIAEISFSGISAFSRNELLNAISSKEYSTFGSGAYPQDAMIADDCATIVELYREHGYLNADVPGWTLTALDKDDDESKIRRVRLEFIVHEGPQSHFMHRQIRYRDREFYDKFDVVIDQPENDIFSDSVFRAERAAVTKQLRARGHATVADAVHCTSYGLDGSVASEETCEIAEFPSACFPDVAKCETKRNREGYLVEQCLRHYQYEDDDPENPECRLANGITGTDVDVEYDVTLGPKYAFGDVFVHGHVNTKGWVVERDITFQDGETFDINKVIDSRGYFRRRTIYKTATMTIIGVDDDLTTKSESDDSTSTAERNVPIVVNLEEGEPRWFDVAFGVQYTSGDAILSGEIEYVEANIGGSGMELRALLMPEARVSRDGEIVFTQKFNQNFFALITLTAPSLVARNVNLVGQLYYDLRYIPDTNKEEQGFLFEAQYTTDYGLFSALAIEYAHSQKSSFGIDVSGDISNYHACYPVTWGMSCPFAGGERIISLTPRVSYDKRDNPLSPKSGYYTEGKVKVAAFRDDITGNWSWYVRPEARFSYIYTFLKYYTLAFNLHLGLSFMPEGMDLPYTDRYFLGGLNMRGYDNEALGPRLINDITPNVASNEAAGGEVLFNFTTEIRFPIWESIGLYGAIFLDMGALTQYQPLHYSAKEFAEELFVNQMRYTAGLGLRWLISESIPPIVIDYGFLLNRHRGDPLGGFTLNVGYTF